MCANPGLHSNTSSSLFLPARTPSLVQLDTIHSPDDHNRSINGSDPPRSPLLPLLHHPQLRFISSTEHELAMGHQLCPLPYVFFLYMYDDEPDIEGAACMWDWEKARFNSRMQYVCVVTCIWPIMEWHRSGMFFSQKGNPFYVMSVLFCSVWFNRIHTLYMLRGR